MKMVHDGIEYGIMAAYAEGLNILRNANGGKVARAADAETAPLEQPQFHQHDIDATPVAEVWRRGSVIGSWLMDLTAAIDEGVPAPVLATAPYSRFASRGNDDFADQVLSAMRKQFIGHDEKPAEEPSAGS